MPRSKRQLEELVARKVPARGSAASVGNPWRQGKVGLMLKGLADLKCCGAQEPDQTSLARSHLPSVLQVRSFRFCACALLCVASKRRMLSAGEEASSIFCHGQEEEGMSQRIAPIDNDTPHFVEKDPAIHLQLRPRIAVDLSTREHLVTPGTGDC